MEVKSWKHIFWCFTHRHLMMNINFFFNIMTIKTFQYQLIMNIIVFSISNFFFQVTNTAQTRWIAFFSLNCLTTVYQLSDRPSNSFLYYSMSCFSLRSFIPSQEKKSHLLDIYVTIYLFQHSWAWPFNLIFVEHISFQLGMWLWVLSYKQLTHEPKPWTININAFLDHLVNVSFQVNLDQFLQYQLPTPESSSMVKAVSHKCIPWPIIHV